MSAVTPLSSAMLTRLELEVSIAFTSASLFSITAFRSCSSVAGENVGAVAARVGFEPAVSRRGVVCWVAAEGNAAAGAERLLAAELEPKQLLATVPTPKHSAVGWAISPPSVDLLPSDRFDCDLRCGDTVGAAPVVGGAAAD